MSREIRTGTEPSAGGTASDGAAPGRIRRGALERVTVNLTPRSSRALDEVVGLTQDTKTEAINRALQVYAYLERVLQEGGVIYTQGADAADLERLRFI